MTARLPAELPSSAYDLTVCVRRSGEELCSLPATFSIESVDDQLVVRGAVEAKVFVEDGKPIPKFTGSFRDSRGVLTTFTTTTHGNYAAVLSSIGVDDQIILDIDGEEDFANFRRSGRLEDFTAFTEATLPQIVEDPDSCLNGNPRTARRLKPNGRRGTGGSQALSGCRPRTVLE